MTALVCDRSFPDPLGVVSAGGQVVRFICGIDLSLAHSVSSVRRTSRAFYMWYRSFPDPLGIVLWCCKLVFGGRSQGIEQHCHSEPVLFPGVGISIEFWAIYRHPFVGAVIDRPPGRARTQVVTNLVYNRFCPDPLGIGGSAAGLSCAGFVLSFFP